MSILYINYVSVFNLLYSQNLTNSEEGFGATICVQSTRLLLFLVGGRVCWIAQYLFFYFPKKKKKMSKILFCSCCQNNKRENSRNIHLCNCFVKHVLLSKCQEDHHLDSHHSLYFKVYQREWRWELLAAALIDQTVSRPYN